MPRCRRPHLPGVPFHLTARTQGKTPLFRGMEQTVARAIRRQARLYSGELLAFAVMPNHLHFVLVQGARPMSDFMQPLLRRLALHAHGRYRSEGHVFERRYWSAPCTDPDYLRNAIAYVHLNPVRGHLCDGPEHYQWTSHADYCSLTPAAFASATAGGLRLFTPRPGAALAEIHGTYHAFLAWRMSRDGWSEPSDGHTLPPRCPDTLGGDGYWAERFGWSCTVRAENQWPRPPALDLRDLALKVLRELGLDMDLDLLRSGQRTRALVAVRRQVILRAKGNGHRNRSIARFLHISDVTVSRT